MHAIQKAHGLILHKERELPEKGIICAHPGRTERIARENFHNLKVHTNYRGFQVYTGFYDGKPIFAANTGIGAPAAAFLIEELMSFGAKRIIRLGSNDSKFSSYRLKVVRESTLPAGLCQDYKISEDTRVHITESLLENVCMFAREKGMPVEISRNRHIDGYFAVNFTNKNDHYSEFNSQDMESGALYLLAKLRNIEFLSLLISYPKHETKGEYKDGGESLAFEARAIDFALDLLVNR